MAVTVTRNPIMIPATTGAGRVAVSAEAAAARYQNKEKLHLYKVIFSQAQKKNTVKIICSII